MTVVIGYTNGTNVWMVGDDIAASNDLIEYISQPKIFTVNDEMLIGFTTSFRMGQILQYITDIPKLVEHGDIYKYIHTIIIPKIMEAFEKAKYLKVDNNVATGGFFLIGIRGKLFTVQEDFSVMEYASPYAVIGCGYQYGLAAMEALESYTSELTQTIRMPVIDPIEYKLKSALKISSKFSPYVSLKNKDNIKVFKI